MYVYPFRPLNVTLENSWPISTLYQCIFQQKILFGISFVLKEVNRQPTQKKRSVCHLVTLKGLCHKDIGSPSRSFVCWSHYLKFLYPPTKCSCSELWRYTKQISPGSTNQNNCFGNFGGKELKLVGWPDFFKFKSNSMPISYP